LIWIAIAANPSCEVTKIRIVGDDSSPNNAEPPRLLLTRLGTVVEAHAVEHRYIQGDPKLAQWALHAEHIEVKAFQLYVQNDGTTSKGCKNALMAEVVSLPLLRSATT
jgi:hypothetical protein